MIKFQKLDCKIEDYYQLNYTISSSLVFDIFRGYQENSKDQRLILVSKQLHDSNDHSFLFNRFSKVGLTGVKVFDYGIDADGYAYSVLENDLVETIDRDNNKFGEKMRRLKRVMTLVDSFHQEGIIFAYLNNDSFWFNKNGQIVFPGLITPAGEFAVQDFDLTLVKQMSYLAPEVINNEEITVASDVYSLGIMAYDFLNGAIPRKVKVGVSGQLEIHDLDIKYDRDFDERLRVVFDKAISMDPGKRFESVENFRTALNEALTAENSIAVVKTERQLQKSNAESEGEMYRIDQHEKLNVSKRRAARNKKLIIGGVLVGLLVIGFLAVSYQKNKYTQAGNVKKILKPFAGGNPTIKDALDQVFNLELELPQRSEAIKQLQEVNDPLAYRALAIVIVEAQEPVLVQDAQRALIKNIEKAGHLRIADQVQEWFRYAQDLKMSVLSAANPVVPRDQLPKQFHKISLDDLNIALRLAVAGYFDFNQSEIFNDFFQKAIARNLKLKNTEGMSSLGLIIAHEAFAKMFIHDIRDHLDQIQSKDIEILLPILSKRNDPLFRSFLSLMQHRVEYGDDAKYLYQFINKDKNLPATIKEALIAVALGTQTQEDIKRVLSFQSQLPNEILTGIVPHIEQRIQKEALYNLFYTRVGEKEPGKTLFEYISHNDYEKRLDYLLPLTRLLSSELYSREDLIEAVNAFFLDKDPNFKVYKSLLSLNNRTLSDLLVQQYHSLLTLDEKLELMRHEDWQIRKQIIPNSKTTDINARRRIYNFYKTETNPEVLDAYRDSFDFIEY